MDGYDQDFCRWVERQAKLMCDRRFDEIDLDNLVEEIESIGRQLAQELEGRMAEIVRLRTLLYALPDDAWAPYWELKVRELRYRNVLDLRDAPSLKNRLPEMIEDARETGRLCVEEELAYAFPSCILDTLLSDMPPLDVEDFFE